MKIIRKQFTMQRKGQMYDYYTRIVLFGFKFGWRYCISSHCNAVKSLSKCGFEFVSWNNG